MTPLRSTIGGALFLLAGLQYLLAETIAAAAWSNPAYNYAVNYISDLGVPVCGIEYSGRELCSPLFWLMNTGFVVDGVLFLTASVLLAVGLPPRWRVALLSAAALHAVGNVLVGLFDETTGSILAGLPRTHVVGATLAILFGNATAVLAGAWLLRSGYRWGLVVVILGSVGVVAFLALAAGSFGLPEGAVERMAVYPITAFELLAGVVALTLGIRRVVGRRLVGGR